MRIAQVLSVLLHPLLMPVITVWLALQMDPQLGYFLSPDGRWMMLAMLALMTIAFPITSALLLQRSGLLGSLEMPERQERIAPFAMTFLYFAMAYYLLRQAPLHPAMNAIFLGAVVALGLTILITLRWKVSAHMVGIGGMAGAITAIGMIHGLAVLPFVAVVTIVAGLLGTARLLVSDHTQGQIVVGALIGWLCTYTPVVLGWSL